MAYQEPEFLPWDGVRSPITFVAGYLGAGKTTVINRVLAATDRPIAVIVNDVGAINVDARLVRRRSGETIELTDGCVCCSSVDGLGAAFDRIRDRSAPPEHVLVELSGVAEPANVVPWGRSAGFLLDGVVVVVAVDQLVGATLPRWIRAHIDAQLAAADLVVLTKADRAEPEEVRAARFQIADTAPDVPIVDAAHRSDDPGALGRFLSLGGHRGGDATAMPGPTLFDLHHTHTVAADGALDDDGIRRLVASLPDRFGETVVRAKGIVAGPDRVVRLVQVVGRRCEITPLLPNEEQAPTDLVVITLAPGD